MTSRLFFLSLWVMLVACAAQSQTHGHLTRITGVSVGIQLDNGLFVAPGERFKVLSRRGRTLAFGSVESVSGRSARGVLIRKGGDLIPQAAVQFNSVEEYATLTLRTQNCQGSIYSPTGRGVARLGASPYVVEKVPGDYTYILRCPGYREQREQVVLKSGQPETRAVSLVPLPSGSGSPEGGPSTAEPAAPVSLTIEAEPADAIVTSGGQRLGGVPFQSSYRPGDYTFHVRREGYRSQTVRVVLTPGTPIERQITLRPIERAEAPPLPEVASGAQTSSDSAAAEPSAPEPDLFTLGVRILPKSLADSAIVVVQGQIWDGDADQLRLAPGTYEIQVEADGYYAPPLRVRVPGDRWEVVTFNLEENRQSTLAITSNRTGASAYVDGAYVGPVGSSPITIPVEPGERLVEIRAKGYEPFSEVVEAAPNAETVAGGVLKPLVGWLRIGAPAEGIVRLDGVEVGQGPLAIRASEGTYDVQVVVGTEVMLRQPIKVLVGEDVPVDAGGELPPRLKDLESTLGNVSLSAGASDPIAVRPETEGPEQSAPERADVTETLDAVLPTVPDVTPLPSLTSSPSPRPAQDTSPDSPEQAPEQVSEPIVADAPELSLTSPTESSSPSTETRPTSNASAPSPRPAGDIPEEVLALVRNADYAQAEDALLELVRVREARDLLDAVQLARVRIAELSEQQLADLALFREHVEHYGAYSEWGAFRKATDRIFDLIPGDPSARLMLSYRLGYPAELSDGSVLEAVYVPGTRARPITMTPSIAVLTAPPEQGFRLSVTEITNEQFAAFLNTQDRTREFVVRRPRELRRQGRGPWTPVLGAEQHPVTDATWAGARAFASWAGGRLPTWSEWEWAYRLGSAGLTSFQTNTSTYAAREQEGVVRVSGEQFSADRAGLFHMIGNVAEWLNDGRDGRQIAIAGGSYADDVTAIRASLRSRADAETPGSTVGFRLLFPLPSDDD